MTSARLVSWRPSASREIAHFMPDSPLGPQPPHAQSKPVFPGLAGRGFVFRQRPDLDLGGVDLSGLTPARTE